MIGPKYLLRQVFLTEHTAFDLDISIIVKMQEKNTMRVTMLEPDYKNKVSVAESADRFVQYHESPFEST